MRKLVIILICIFPVSLWAISNPPRQSNEFSTINGARVVRSITSVEGNPQSLSQNQPPFRNPHIMGQVLWVDRNHENAIAQNVTTTPDGSGIFAGWWLNNQRYAAYTSAGLDSPIWRYNQATQWYLPVAASDSIYTGSGSALPAFLWHKDNPINIGQINIGPADNGYGLAFSGDGSILAFVVGQAQGNGLLIVYNTSTNDTVFTRTFDPTRGINGVDISRDGSIAVVSTYDLLYAYEVPSGNLRGAFYNYSQDIAKVSGDGLRVVGGTFTGYAYLYQWNGSEYLPLWANPTQHDWVSAVDISDDGSTVACGTLDFVGGQIGGGKFMMWDAESGNVLIDYGEYGDMVASVALSSNGRYAIAGSWGKYGATFGDVVTCFIRDSETPIFQLLDDVDEPGSIFGVAISDSGHYATAGGKAVHARYFGNGGMLYSIQVRDPLTNDVAVSAIDQPTEFAAPGESITPSATFINVGDATATFDVNCQITDADNGTVLYNSFSSVSDLGSFINAQVSFSPDFTFPSDGRYRVLISAEMAGDQDISNNSLSLASRSLHDIQAVAIISPFNEVTVNWSFAPQASFKNLGSYTENADVMLTIYDSTNAEVYTAISSLFELAPYSIEQMTFDAWAPSEPGLFRAVFTAVVPDDFTPDNNVISKSFLVTNEMIYDDGNMDAAYWVGGNPLINCKFGQRFESSLPAPFTITNVKFFLPNVSYTGSFDYIGVATEVDGSPDTANFLSIINNPLLPELGNWASYDINYTKFDNDPLWLVLHWADADQGVSGPYVGADYTQPLDHQSYWTADDTTLWVPVTYADWMMRMTIESGIVGTSEIVSGLPAEISLKQNYPNPFNPSTKIEFALPNAGQVNLEIYNYMGQKVRSLVDTYLDAGYHTSVWDGKTELGANASSGIYYYRLTCGEYRISKKMTMLK